MVVDLKRGIMLRYNLGHVNESLNHQCRWHWLLKGVQPISCIPNQYPWSILVGLWGKTGLPICAILLFPCFVMAIFVSIERTIFLGLNLMKTLKFCCSHTSSELDPHAWTQTSRVICGITVSEMSARAGRCDKDLQESFLPSSRRSSRITWGCQVVVAAYVWAAESRLGMQAPKEDLNHSIKSVYRAAPFMLGHTD